MNNLTEAGKRRIFAPDPRLFSLSCHKYLLVMLAAPQWLLIVCRHKNEHHLYAKW